MSPKLRTLRRVVMRAALAVVAFLVLYGLSAVVLARIPVNSSHRAPTEGMRIYIVSNGVHTDFVVPMRSAVIDWTTQLPPSSFARVDDSFEYLEFGWGDRGFYLETPTWADLKASTAFKACFFLSSSAMHVTCWRLEPRSDATCRRLLVSEEQYRKLVEFLKRSFVCDERGAFRRIDHPGYTPQDAFFEANGTYSFIHTCNEWTGAGLREMGVKTAVWTPFAKDVLRFLPE